MKPETTDLYDAFRAGFAISGEGWNGEYPTNDPKKKERQVRKEFNKWKRRRA